jgi:hypothetical protein
VTRLDWWRLRCRFWCKLIGTTSELLPGDCSLSSVLGDDFGKDLIGALSDVSGFLSSCVVGRGRSGKRACGDVVLLHNPSQINAAAAAATAIIIDVFITFLASRFRWGNERKTSFKLQGQESH